MWIVLSLLAGAFVVLVVANLFVQREEDRAADRASLRGQRRSFLRAMGSVLGPPVVAGNKVTRAGQRRPDLPGHARGHSRARRSITFETYIYWSGHRPRVRPSAGRAGARRVKVHVLLDWVGASKMTRLTRRMTRRCASRKYHPLRWYNLAGQQPHPPQALVVDGRIGFTGGVGIADSGSGNAQDPDHWRDSHFRSKAPPSRRSGRVHGQLDEARGHRAARRRILPRRSSGGQA